VLNDELDDFKWLPPDALGDLKLTGGLPEVIQSARRLIGPDGACGSRTPPRLASSALKGISRASWTLHAQAFSGRSHLISACASGPARAQDAAAPFDGDLQRLAEILGTLHYLRGICGTNEGRNGATRCRR
jgi:hypothetical protein